MPGLTVNTDGTGIPQTPVPVPVPNIAGYTPPAAPTGAIPSSSSSSAAAAVASAGAAAPAHNRPQPLPRAVTTTHPPAASRVAPAPPPPAAPVAPRAPAAHAISVPAAPAPGPSAAGSSSPTRPPVSPITPPLNAVPFPPPRQSHAHSAHPPQTVVAPPPPEPIEFDTNPDVLALKSAISVLQMQSKKAKRDMVSLQQAKMAALDNTKAFVADLTNGHVHMEGAGPCNQPSSSSSEGEDEDDEDGAQSPERAGQTANNKAELMDMTATGGSSREPRPWSNLPAAQNIYRCPPINWSQYAVAGESLDKLHSEQQGRPAQGVPATLTPDGRYEFKGVGKQEDFIGVAAPYNPLKDALNKRKPKGPTR